MQVLPLLIISFPEGVLQLWRGASLNVTRGVLITVAQVQFRGQQPTPILGGSDPFLHV